MDLERVRRESGSPVVAAKGDLEAVCQDLSAAFAEDPLLNWLLRQDSRRHRARLAFFRMEIPHEAFRIGEIERPQAGGGAALWFPSERLGPNPLSVRLRAITMFLGACGPPRFPRVLALREAMDRRHPMDRPHDYLWMLGVRPEVQGRGVGSGLLKARLDRLDVQGRPAFLETSVTRSLSLFRRHGFVVIDEYRPAPSGPTIWSMWRDPWPPG